MTSVHLAARRHLSISFLATIIVAAKVQITEATVTDVRDPIAPGYGRHHPERSCSRPPLPEGNAMRARMMTSAFALGFAVVGLAIGPATATAIVHGAGVPAASGLLSHTSTSTNWSGYAV